MSSVRQINVRATAGSQRLVELAPLLESVLPVKFNFSPANGPGAVGELFIGGEADRAAAQGAAGLPSLQIPQSSTSNGNGKPEEITVRFADDAGVPFPFRGRTVSAKVASGAKCLAVSANDKVLAKSDQSPVWAVSEKDGVKHFKSGFPIPCLPANGGLNEVIHEGCFLEMVFLIQWLREACALEFQGPPLRACYIIDDPNLHWPSYGHVNYRQMAERAERENYHVSFATIPLDAWFTHRGTAEIFKQHSRRLSLGIHGNDHVKRELARPYSEQERLALLHQSIGRIEQLERKTGVQVCRVMVPPHGACSDDMLGDLPKAGFEAASISHGSLRAHNRTKAWTRSLGYLPCELVNGCPVMPRWSLTVNSNTVLLAAYFKQTIILRGHQDDLKGGIEILDRHAQFINSLGNVTWSNLTDLSRMNYQWRMNGNACYLQPISPKISFPLPKGTTKLVLDSSLNGAWSRWRISGSYGAKIEARSGETISLPEQFQGTLFLETTTPTKKHSQDYSRRSATSAVVRRLLTEGRDRFVFWK